MHKRKLLEKALTSPKNLSFHELVTLVEAFGFRLSRIRGSHFIFVHPGIPELINIQEKSGKAKPYQVREFLMLVARYHLQLGGEA